MLRFLKRNERSTDATASDPWRTPDPWSSPRAFARQAHQFANEQSRMLRRGLIGRYLAPAWRRIGWKGRILFVVPAAVATGLTTGLAFVMIYFTLTLPDPMQLRKQQAAPTLRLLAADGSVLAERGQNHPYIPLDLLPRHVIDAVIAVEDRRFFEHWGLDPAGLARAAFANLRSRSYAQGGSTLTQQLAKNLFLSSERTLSRKIDEVLLTLWLEVRLSKDEILELYLNRVYFGGGAYGVEAAARRYFDRSARDLSLTQAAVLAGLLKAPSKFSPASNPVLARTRARSVIAKMVASGLLSSAEEHKAIHTAIRFHDPATTRELTGLEYAVDYVLERLPQVAGVGNRAVVVETTIDAGLQRHAQAELARLVGTEGEEGEASQAGLVVIDNDGAIRALVGGRSYLESQFNRAIKAKRQPGSAFKTFVYLGALESGLQPESTVYDLPFVINGWSPRNESGSYRGAVSLRNALAQSINTVAVRLHMDLGPKRIVATAQRLGIKSDLRDGPSLALGTSEVTLLELTGAYAAFANGGRRVEPHIVRRVIGSDGRLIHERSPRPETTVVAPAHVGAMNDMLNATLVSGTGRQAGLARHPAAGKTGTSQEFRDAWFVGYTGHFTAGVWLGNDNGKPMNRVMGGTLPAKLWRTVMARAHEGKAPVPLPGTIVEPIRVKPQAAASEDDPIAAVLARTPVPRGQFAAERIDPAFVEKALRDDAWRPRPRPAAAEPAGAVPATASQPAPVAAPGARVWSGFDTARFRAAWTRLDEDRRDAAAPPPGQMSLGRPQ